MTPRAQLPKSKGSAESVTRPVRRVGEGPTPCWVCGRDGHRYGDCPKKKKNVVCGVCGSQAHPPHTCPQRYFPEFRTGNFGAWRNQPRNATYVRSSGNRKAASTTRGENPRLEGDSMRAMSGSTERTSEESGAQALLIRALPSETLLGLAQRISSKCESLPTQDPTHRKLKYYVKIGDHDAVALLDTGATHSFLHLQTAKKWKLALRERPPMSVGFFNKESMLIRHEVTTWVTMGSQRRRWTFLVLGVAADLVVLGLDIIRAWHLVVDPRSLALYIPRVGKQVDFLGVTAKQTQRDGPRRCWMWTGQSQSPSIKGSSSHGTGLGDVVVKSPTVDGKYHFLAGENSDVQVYTVTASSLEEEEAMQTFLASAPKDLKELVMYMKIMNI